MNETEFQNLLDDMSFIDNWEDRYRYVIELGQQLESMPPSDMIEENKVQGCASQVWLTHEISNASDDPVISFKGQSDAHIVQGLVAIALKLFSDIPTKLLADADPMDAFTKLGLASHLSSQRSNGLKSLLAKMQHIAAQASKS